MEKTGPVRVRKQTTVSRIITVLNLIFASKLVDSIAEQIEIDVVVG
jgi:hypothetical protein